MFQFQNPKIPEFLPTNELVFQAYSIPICANNHPFETQLARGCLIAKYLSNHRRIHFKISDR